MNCSLEDQENKEVEFHRPRCIHGRFLFIRKPFDIDLILGNNEHTFEQFEAKYRAAMRDKRPAVPEPKSGVKRRRTQASKIWISELQDIDKIYKTSELRDIIATAQEN
ncbi:hypothetical protein AB6A40_002193 [Gnathostoma spinigerum]|uniref:Uncharacterized protein n=1 Tax=Gnathostoma spinigerum TaxID=75299 RepID=A0ABD6EDQ3_9BILA